MLWYKRSSVSTGQTIFYYGSSDVTNGAHIEIRQTNTSRLRIRYGSGNNYLQLSAPAGTLSANTWHQIVLTYDGGTTGASSANISNYHSRFSLYVDGSAVTTSNSHGNYGWSGAISGQNLRIGRFASGNYLRGSRVDELAIWGSDQTTNLSNIYNSGSTQNLLSLSTSPDHWWRMGDGDTFPTLQDNVGSAHFVLYNMTTASIVTDAP